MPESEDYSFISNIIQEISRYSESSSIFDFLFEMIVNILKSNGIMETRVAFIILANLIEIYEGIGWMEILCAIIQIINDVGKPLPEI